MFVRVVLDGHFLVAEGDDDGGEMQNNVLVKNVKNVGRYQPVEKQNRERERERERERGQRTERGREREREKEREREINKKR